MLFLSLQNKKKLTDVCRWCWHLLAW